MIKKFLLSNFVIFIIFVSTNLLANWLFPTDFITGDIINDLATTSEVSQNQIELIKAGLAYSTTTKFFVISLIISTLISYLVYYFIINIFINKHSTNTISKGAIITRSYFLGLIPIIIFNIFETITLIIRHELYGSLFLNVCYFISVIGSIEVSFMYLAKNGFKLTKQKLFIYVIVIISSIIIYLFEHSI